MNFRYIFYPNVPAAAVQRVVCSGGQKIFVFLAKGFPQFTASMQKLLARFAFGFVIGIFRSLSRMHLCMYLAFTCYFFLHS